MKIIIASDTHGRNERLAELESLYPDASLFLHAGDWGGNPEKYDHWITVKGNNDIAYRDILENQKIVLADGHSILLIHGHQMPAGGREQALVKLAKRNGCDIVVYGHTHKASVTQKDGIWIINPGSLSRSRDGYGLSYCVLDIDKEHVDARIVRWINRPNQKS